jgi:hypothetical protein
MCDGAARLTINIVPGKHVAIGYAVCGATNWGAVYYFRSIPSVVKYTFDIIARPTSKYANSSVDYGFCVNIVPYALNSKQMRSAMFGGYGTTVNTNVVIDDWFKWETQDKPLIKPIIDREITHLVNFKFLNNSTSILLYQTDKEADIDALPGGHAIPWRENLIMIPYDDHSSANIVGGTIRVGDRECLVYYVKTGETLDSISKAFLVSKEQLLQMNPGLKTNSTMSDGQSIIIPVPKHPNNGR